MKTRKQKQAIRAPRKMNHKFSRKLPGLVEIQTVGWSKNNELLCAGVYYVPALTARIVYQIATSWRRWRKWYDNLPENRNEPYTHGDDLLLGCYGAHPIDDPKSVLYVQF